MTTTTKIWMRHASFERALRGAASMAAKYPGQRFAVRADRACPNMTNCALVEVI